MSGGLHLHEDGVLMLAIYLVLGPCTVYGKLRSMGLLRLLHVRDIPALLLLWLLWPVLVVF